MKRFLASFLVLTMMISLAVPGLSFMVSAEEIAGDSVVAEMIDTVPAFNEAITEEVWGKPAATISTESNNTVLFNYNGTADADVSADMYFRWDASNLYIGMVSEDNYLAGHDDAWAGDGIQIRVSAGNVNTDSFIDTYVTLEADGATFDGGSTGSASSFGLVAADGKLNVMIAIPFEKLGATSAVGTKLTFNMLRITGNETNPYAGWLAWGPFFGANSDNNPGLTNCNTLTLKDSDAAEGAMAIDKIAAAPALDAAITEEVWGKPVATINADTANAVVFNYNGTADADVSADMYFRWDDTNLYIGMVSADDHLAGHDDAWAGDGIQIRVSAGAAMGAFVDTYVTLEADGASFDGGSTGDASSFGLVAADGKINVMIAVPFEALGVEAAYDTILSFNMLRITGNETHPYAGWLAWGPFFGVGSDNNPGVTAHNKLILKDTAFEAALIETHKIETAPDLSVAITEEAWGAPAATINADTANAVVFNYNGTADADVSADMYFRWDATNLYVGMVSADDYFAGHDDAWAGDGIQIRFTAGTKMGDFHDTYITLEADGASFDGGSTSGKADYNVVIADGKLNIMIALPLEVLGVEGIEGEFLSFNMLRITGNETHGYAGWLAWGPFFGVGSDNNPGVTAHNTLVLAGVPVVEPDEPEEIVVPEGAIQSVAIDAAPALDAAITEAVWGKPVATINADTANAVLFNYNGTADADVSADMYFRWDATNLYIGMVSEDDYFAGHDDAWAGDGIQIRVSAGNVNADAFIDTYVTLEADGASFDGGSTGDASDFGVVLADGKINVMIALPFEALGVTPEEGVSLTFNMLRITGNETHPYAGWLAWGPFFGVGSDNNPGVEAANTLFLVNEFVEPEAPEQVVVPEGAIQSVAIDAAPALDAAITEAVWGKPVATINADTANAVLFNYNGTADEDVSADMYFRWDATNLYIGMVSEDDYFAGHDDAWAGDGIQIRVSAGNVNADAFIDTYVTLEADGASFDGGSTGDASSFGLVAADGKINVMIALPFEALGVTPEEGVSLTFNMLRITGNETHPYAGWLAWGPFFGVGSDNNPGVEAANTLFLVDEYVEPETPEVPEIVIPEGAVQGTAADAAPDFNTAITEAVWGKPAVTFDKNSANTVKFDYNGTCEDVSADIYLKWDANYLYVGMVSEDSNLGGSADSWVGDGIQFKVAAGDVMSDAALNIYVTLDANGTGVTAGGGGASGYEKNIVVADGKINVMVAVPFADLGITPEAGAILTMSALRISGTSDVPYAGWLAWGAFFGADHANNPGLTADNTVILVDEYVEPETPEVPEIVIPEGAVQGTASAAPDFNAAITESAWGKPVMSVADGKGNAAVYSYEGTPDANLAADMYFRWDAENLYVGMVTADADIKGDDASYKGDGIQFRINAGEAMGEFIDVYVTLAGNNTSVQAGHNDKIGDYAHNIVIADGKLNIMFAIPFAALGVDAAEGQLFAFNFLRISGANGSGYAGWLACGPFFDLGHDYNPGLTVTNKLVLVDKYVEVEHKHTEETIPAVAPTCKDTGLTEGKKCSVCGETLVAQEVVPVIPHTEETIPAVAATCKDTGLTEGKKCTACGDTLVAQEVVPVIPHTEEVIPAVAATCTDTGLTEGKKCTACGDTLVAQETVPALEHDFADEFTVDVEPTYEADGSKSRHCSRCEEKTDVTAIPKLVNSADIFKDVKKNSWFKDAVDYAVYNGLMNGKTADTFAPNEATTRAQLVTVLWRLEGEPAVDVDVPFTDLKQDWYKDAVAWAYANGIVNGKTATTFAPNGNITREEIAAILYRYANFKGFDVTESKDLDFTDAGRVHDYAVDAMKWAYAEELITGSDEGGKLLLAPRGNATRAQIATLLMRFCENIAK